ncbi:MAG: ATP-binding protein [Dehalococcoidia bacterium]
MTKLAFAEARKALNRSSVADDGILESLSDETVVLDQKGDIVATNKAWRSFSDGASDLESCAGDVGDNYLDVCRRSAAAGDRDAQQAFDGISSVLAGTSREFSMTYDCPSPSEHRTYSLTASPLTAEFHGAVVCHREIMVSPSQRLQLPGNPSSRSFSSVDVSIMPAMAKNLAKTLGVRHAVICELVEGYPRRARVVTHWAGNDFAEGIEYIAGGTPCEQVIDGSLCHIASHLQEVFPEDAWLASMNAESYMGVPVYDGSGKVIGHVAVIDTKPFLADMASELTLRLAAIRAAAELEHRKSVWKAALEARLVESARDAIVGTDQNLLITSWNPAAESIYGWRADEVIGRKVSEVLRTEMTEDVKQEALRAVQAEGEFRGEYVQHRRDGSLVDVEATTICFRGYEGAVSGYVSVNRDISGRKRSEERLQQALTAKDQFLSLISHELRTPLTLIMGNAWSMAHRSESQTTERMIENSEIIYAEAVKLTSIVENLLLLARAERGERIKLEPIDLAGLSRKAADHPRVPGQHRIEVDVRAGRLLTLANATAVEQVILNLLTNAAKYSPENSTIFVSLGVEGDAAIVSVRDQGRGIRDEALQAVFQPFYRGGDVSAIPGMGVGLTVCRRLVEAMNGRIWAQNHPDGGAVFSVALPLLADVEDSLPSTRRRRHRAGVAPVDEVERVA